MSTGDPKSEANTSGGARSTRLLVLLQGQFQVYLSRSEKRSSLPQADLAEKAAQRDLHVRRNHHDCKPTVGHRRYLRCMWYRTPTS